ncbi:hypothetical protein BOTBODRAFT_36166 [Botryobasidium botryosum FD-172 SS1]|uniref:aspartate kinase n=1 Tax=Botryobasidium botryosum (strain FD-172 SS1) TaxID=930990 RepID=A0A067M4J0_BOTB1|nr:hypothetical protein BOTBODRAFT_36166 [Botryobasidium botryosum FD-172 SS1]
MSGASTPTSSSPPDSVDSAPDTPSPPTPPSLHQNSIDPASKWLVQKFGGTSVGKFAAQIAEVIVPAYLDQHKVAVVCSARSGSTKSLGTTNLLLRAATEALRPSGNVSSSYTPGARTPSDGLFGRPPSRTSHSRGTFGDLKMSSVASPSRTPSQSKSPSPSSPPSVLPSSVTSPTKQQTSASAVPSSYNQTIDLIRSEHIGAARFTIRDPDLLRQLVEEIEGECEGLRSFLFAAQVIDEISPRSRDILVGAGERLACKLVATVLRDRGIDSEVVSLENIVPPMDDDDSAIRRGHGPDDVQLDQEFYDRLSVAVGERVLQCGSRVPIVTGFFGPVPGSLLRQVGRGYTDLLAALLAVGLGASELQIWKEVDGIFTADPRKVLTARLIPIISPEEAAELTYYGSEVVHPFTMEQVIRKNIPIRIKNVENPRGGGTVIHPNPDLNTVRVPPTPSTPGEIIDPLQTAVTSLPALQTLTTVAAAALADASSQLMPKLPTAVTIKDRIVILNVHSNRKTISHGFLARIFETLDRFGIVVDLISTSEVQVSMAIENGAASGGRRRLDRLARELGKSGTVTMHHDMAILSLVGKQMKNLLGIAGRMFSTLAEGKVNIEMISQGASEINISCVIDGRDAVKALNLIHQSCLQIRPEGARGRVGPWLF